MIWTQVMFVAWGFVSWFNLWSLSQSFTRHQSMDHTTSCITTLVNICGEDKTAILFTILTNISGTRRQAYKGDKTDDKKEGEQCETEGRDRRIQNNLMDICVFYLWRAAFAIFAIFLIWRCFAENMKNISLSLLKIDAADVEENFLL